MQMFVGGNGRERTLDERIELAPRGGFVLDDRIGLRSLGQILLFRAA